MKDIIISTSIEIKASKSKIWQSLVTPSIIKEYMFGTETISDWKIGSEITFKGIWNGVEYIDGGIITEFIENKVLEYTYFSSMSKLDKIPANYNLVRFEIVENHNTSKLTVYQDNIKDNTIAEHSKSNWDYVLNQIKSIVER